MTRRNLYLFLILILVVMVGGMSFFFMQNRELTLPDQGLRTGTAFGFIRGVTVTETGYLLAFDDAVWLEGEAAQDAAVRAGLCQQATKSDCLGEQFFIENTNKETVDLPINQQAAVVMQTYISGEPDDGPETITLETFAGIINDPTLHFKDLPYKLELKNSTVVTKIEEQYVP